MDGRRKDPLHRGRRVRFADLLATAARVVTVSEVGVIAALVLLVVVFSSMNSAFLSAANLRAMLAAASFVGIIAVGQTMLLVGGEFDLSVGSTAGLSAVVSAWLMTRPDWPVPLGLAAGLATGLAVGLVNGTVVVKFKIPAFIATLGMLYVAGGLNTVITNGNPIYPLPGQIGRIGASTFAFKLGWSVLVMLVLLVAGDLVLRRTTVGRNLYATGGNREVARLVGINTERYRLVCFTLTGGLAAVAGLLVMASLDDGSTSIGQGWELSVIAGVVVGGVSLFGGVGTVLAGLTGILLLQVVQSGLVVIGVSANWQPVAVGVIMIMAVGLDIFRRRISTARAARRSGEPDIPSLPVPGLPAEANAE